MADNLANGWGTSLIFEDPKWRKQVASGNSIDSSKADFRLFEEDVKASTNGNFTLSKICSCGSEANAFAICETTGGDTSACLFAAGSYVAGDGGTLQMLTTSSAYGTHLGPCIVCIPDRASAFAQKQTVALPYFIPGKE